MEQMRNEINELIEQSKQKAKVLTEALPYIRRFNNCYVVVKYGQENKEGTLECLQKNLQS